MSTTDEDRLVNELSQKVLIIIPAYNEVDSIAGVIEAIQKECSEYDYIIINDGSSDGTRELCNRNSYHFLDLSVNLGIGGAVQTGYKYAWNYGYDIAVQIDGDGQHDVTYIKKVIDPLISGEADIAIGSRFIQSVGGHKGFQSLPIRRVGIYIISNSTFPPAKLA